jgi:Raf kinase inhibitor-like YbhB/YbcL family protein
MRAYSKIPKPLSRRPVAIAMPVAYHRAQVWLIAAAMLVLASTFARGQDSSDRIAITALGMTDQPKIKVTSESFTADGPIAETNSAYRENRSPTLAWTAVRSAQSYMVVVEDPDVHPKKVVHWLVWNIPAAVTSLSEGLESKDRLSNPPSAVQGTNSHKTVGYYGPHPPVADEAHHYHFQVIALDRMLDVSPGSDLDQVLSAAKGHVISSGEIIGLFAAPKS